MIKSKVAVIRCENYDEAAVYESVKKGMLLLGGLSSFVKKSDKVLVKPNLLASSRPSENVSPHPSVFNAVLKMLVEEGIDTAYGDSPAFENQVSVLKKAGLYDIAKRYPVNPGNFEKGVRVEFPEGRFIKEFDIALAVKEADSIISLCKMKTHGLATITGAVKNQFGCIYGTNKAAFHVKIPNAANFSRMLVDINLYIRPKLYIMDGISAMEGNGPRGGDPVNMNCIIISNDPVALDSTFCRMIDLKPEYVATNFYGKEAGLGTYLPEEIEFYGDPPESFINRNFKVSRKPVERRNQTSRSGFLMNLIIPRPVIDELKCTKCGTCVNICPVEGKALNFKDENKSLPPVYNYNKCIRCYCCQETCPYKAITVEKPLLGRIFSGAV